MFCGAISHSMSKLNTPSPQKKIFFFSIENEHRKRKCLHFYKFLNLTTKPTLEIGATIRISHLTPSGVGGL